MNLQTYNLLEQAQLAHTSANWSLLLQCLQQLVSESRKSKVESRTPNASLQERGHLHTQLAPPDYAANVAQVSDAPAASQLPNLLSWAVDILIWGDFHQRWDVSKLLPKFGPEAIAPLLEILADEDADEELRWFTVRCLGSFDSPEAIAALVELLQTSEVEEERAMAAAALAEIGANAVAAITQLLSQASTKLLAVRSLAYIRTKETIEPLLSVVRDSDLEIRAIAIEALSSFHDPKIPPVLIHALQDLGAKVRKEAVTGLSFRTDLREELNLVNLLLPRLYDFSLDVCIAAANGLGRLGTERAAVGLFEALRSHNSATLQIEIVQALGRIATSTSLEYLRQVFDTTTSIAVWQETINALGRIEQLNLKSRAAEILLELLQGDRSVVQHGKLKQAIALALGQLGEVRAIQPLIQLLADSDLAVKLHAIAALKQLNSPIAHQRLAQLATDTSIGSDLQQGVAIALQEWELN